MRIFQYEKTVRMRIRLALAMAKIQPAGVMAVRVPSLLALGKKNF